MNPFQYLMPPKPMNSVSLLSPEEQQMMDLEMLASDNMQVPPINPQMPLEGATMPQVGQPPQAMPNYEQDFDKAFKSQMGSRNEMLEKLKAKLGQAEANKPQGMAAIDLKPFLMATDALGTTKNASYAYHGNEGVKEHKDMMEKLQAQVLQQDDKISDDKLNYIKSQMMTQKLAAAGQRSTLGNEFKLRNEWDSDPITKNTKVVNEGYNKILSAYEGGDDPANYMTMVYGLMKMQDPISSVKEAEFTKGEDIGGWPEKWRAMYQKAVGDIRGGQTAMQKESIFKQAQNILNAQMEAQAPVNTKYKSMAVEYGMAPQRVVLDDIFKPRQPKPKKKNGGKMSFDEFKKSQGL